MVNPPFQSPQAQPESGVRGNVPAPFGAGERLQSPTYRYPDSVQIALGPLPVKSQERGRFEGKHSKGRHERIR